MEQGRRGPLALALCLGVFVTFHLSLIGADSPARIGLVSLDSGTFVDEGYKSYDARNVVLFGAVRWSPADDYGGNWTEGSPLNTGLTEAIFRANGVDLAAVRIANLLFAVGCIVLFWVLLRRRFSAAASLIGTLLLVLHPLFDVFARLALLETKLLFFCMLAVVVMPTPSRADWRTVGRWAAIAFALFAAYQTKPTAIIFMGAFGLGLVSWAVAAKIQEPRALRIVASVVVIGGLIGLSAFAAACPNPDSCGVLSGRAFQPLNVVFTDLFSADVFLMNPAVGALLILGSASLLRRTLGTGASHREDLVIFTWFLVPTIFFAALHYQPERYFLISLPAMIWLAVQGLVELKPLGEWLFERRRDPGALITLAAAVLFTIVNFAPNLLAGVRIGADDGIAASALVGADYGPWLVAMVLAAAVAVKISGDRVRRLARSAFQPTMVLLALVGTAIGVAPLVTWAMSPNYQLEEAAALVDTLGDDTILAGDWAPQLGHLTRVRTVYSNWNEGMLHDLNVDNLADIEATHIVAVVGLNDGYLARIDSIFPGARSTEPVLRLRYSEQDVSIFEFRPGEGAGR